MTVIIVLLVAGLCWYYWLHRAGNLDFWQLVAKNPDVAYDWFVAEDCWVVDSDPAEKPQPRDEFVGPFLLWVPKLGGTRVVIFGLRDEMEASKSGLVERLRS